MRRPAMPCSTVRMVLLTLAIIGILSGCSGGFRPGFPASETVLVDKAETLQPEQPTTENDPSDANQNPPGQKEAISASGSAGLTDASAPLETSNSVTLPEQKRKAISLDIDPDCVTGQVHPMQFGLNLAYTSHAQLPLHTAALLESGFRGLRYPSGLITDLFHWETGNVHGEVKKAETGWTDFLDVCERTGISPSLAQIGINYGTGTPEEAAAWVRDANIVRKLGIRNWEIGNEIWLQSEPDLHGSTLPDGTVLPGKPNDPVTYGKESARYIQAMKRVDPTIQIGVHTNGDPFSSKLYGAMKEAGAVPDFVIYHAYPCGPESSDIATLTHSKRFFGETVASLRNELERNFGPEADGIELFFNEFNATYQAGKQTASLINGLYMADVIGAAMGNGVENVTWFLYRQADAGVTFFGNNKDMLYGWRRARTMIGKPSWYGDIQLIGVETNDKYPTFYMAKLINRFLREGDDVLAVETPDFLLTPYATAGKDGSVRVMLINKSADTAYDADLLVGGGSMNGPAHLFWYGPENDAANATGEGNPDVTITTASFDATSRGLTIPPLTAVLVLLNPKEPLPVRPEPPDVEVAEVSPVAVRLSWEAVPNAHHYDLYWGPNRFNNTYWTLADATSSTEGTILALSPGTEYRFMVRAVSKDGFQSDGGTLSGVTTANMTTSLPFSGTPSAIPGRILAIDYDLGGEGLAYHDTEPANSGTKYRPEEGVDIQDCSLGGFNIGWIQKGEWLNYTVSAQEAATHTIILRFASTESGGQFHLVLDGKDVSGPLSVPDTGDWQVWEEVEVQGMPFPAGVSQLRVVFDANSPASGYVGNLLDMEIK